MKVRELIEQLQERHPDDDVSMLTFNVPGLGDGTWSSHPIQQVEATDDMRGTQIVAVA